MFPPIVFSLPKYPFDYQYITHQLSRYKSPRVKIGSMLRKGEIIRVKKGLYVLSREYGGKLDLGVLSNLVYGPSYVSLEYALSYWGLIPEKVTTITAVTNKKNKRFQTPVGVFSYRYINPRAFAVGRELIAVNDYSFLIGSKEKSLCDKIAEIREIHLEDDVPSYLENDLRINWEEMANLDLELLKQIEKRYSKKSVRLFTHWYEKTFKQKK